MASRATLPCLVDADDTAPGNGAGQAGADAASTAYPLHAVRASSLPAFLESLPEPARDFLRASGFAARPHQLTLLPGPQGVAGAVLGLGDDPAVGPADNSGDDAAGSPDPESGSDQDSDPDSDPDSGHWRFGSLARALPPDTVWRLVPGAYMPAQAVLGFCLGAYRYGVFREEKRAPARLALPQAGGADDAAIAQALSAAAATWMVRDLINTPANLLGPSELADAAATLAASHGARIERIAGAALDSRYPVLAAVGAGSARPPEVAILRWSGTRADSHSPHVALIGKGVCFDTGGYDIKPSSGMLRMKKDMGGAATVLGLARMVMDADLPLHLSLRIGCVENSISGSAMRPSDVLRSRHGLSIEVGNTDAEGRLVLCDLLAEAGAERPALMLDCATLTGAARAALGPDLPALFSNTAGIAAALEESGRAVRDPMWRLPLWGGYKLWLDSVVADTNTVSSKPMAGAIVAALFLQRFVPAGTPWAHFDLYAWNDQSRPGRPEGGEAQAMRAMWHMLATRIVAAPSKQNDRVT